LAIYLAKQIFRNELWTANLRDAECKQLLLQTLEWYKKMSHGEDYETWHAGRVI
jgi:aminoglycoside 6-adenylyltransferase